MSATHANSTYSGLAHHRRLAGDSMPAAPLAVTRPASARLAAPALLHAAAVMMTTTAVTVTATATATATIAATGIAVIARAALKTATVM